MKNWKNGRRAVRNWNLGLGAASNWNLDLGAARSPWAAMAMIGVMTLVTAGPGFAQSPAKPAAGAASAGNKTAVIDKSRLQACPYGTADLRTALATEMRAGKASEQPTGDGRMLGCSYLAVAGGMTLMVSQTWIPAAILGETLASMDRYASGRFTPLKADADGARWLADPQAPNSQSLIYTRRNVRTEIRLIGAKGNEQAMRAQLLKLKRVP